MKLTFLGAAHEVTGSCYYLEACGQRILIDCGMEQGVDYYENEPIPVNASDIDMVLLTHAHIDHSGKLPLLSKEGFRGQVFSTEGTAQLCQIMLMDSAHIQEQDAQWKNRKAERSGKALVEPLYSVEDAQNVLKCFVGLPYETEKYIAEGLRLRFIDAGHLLGSASIELWIREDGIEKKILEGNTDVLCEISAVRNDLRDLKIHYSQLLDLSCELEENENHFFKQENERYFRLVGQRVQMLLDMLISLDGYTVQLRDFCQAKIDQAQNRIMTLLTVISSIFMPLTLLTGWYGMNFKYMPELGCKWAYPAVFVLSLLIAAGCLIFFKKKKWM